jgi:ATP-dependent Lhr-like helicase
VSIIDSAAGLHLLPSPFADWFAAKGWQPRAHQMELLARATAGESLLLIAPTGAGKTLAGFLPALTDLTRRGKIPPGSAFTGVHTLYISPLKALAVDIERNLMKPVADMGLPISVETRTGDTPQLQAPAAAAQSARHPADDARTGRAAASPTARRSASSRT